MALAIDGEPGVHIDFTTAASALGGWLLAATSRGVRRVTIGGSDAVLDRDLRQAFPRAIVRRGDRLLRTQVCALLDLLKGRPPAAEIPLDVRATAFQ